MKRYLLLFSIILTTVSQTQPFQRPFGVTMPLSSPLAADSILSREVRSLEPTDVLEVKDGHFATRDGRRARLFGTLLSYAACYPDSVQAVRLAERFKALGITAVRLRGWEYSSYLVPASASKSDTVLNSANLKKFDWFVYQLRRNGVYVFLSNSAFVPRRNDGVAQYDSINYPWQVRAIQYVDKNYQQAQRRFLRRFFEHVNPYTGVALKDEPGIALMTATDENSLLPYWNNNFRENSTNLLPNTQRRVLDSMFTLYLRNKYKDDKGLISAWGNGAASAENQFKDPGFEDIFTSPWQSQINTGNGAQAAYISSDADKVEGARSAVFKILKGGRSASDVQLVLTGLKLVRGKQYKFSMWMRSPEAGRKANVYLLRGSTPYTNYGLSTSITLNTAWTEHSISFTSTATDDNALFIMQLGMYNSDVYLDKAALTEDTVTVLRSGESLNTRINIVIGTQVVSNKRVLETTDYLNNLQEEYYRAMRLFMRDTLRSHILIGGSSITQTLSDAYTTRGLDFTSTTAYRGSYGIAPDYSKSSPWDNPWSLRKSLNAEDQGGSVIGTIARAKIRNVPLVVCNYYQAYPSYNINELMSYVPVYCAYQDADAYFFGDWVGTNNPVDLDSSWTSKGYIWEVKGQYAMQSLIPSISKAWHEALIQPAADVIRLNYNTTQRQNLRYQVSGHFLQDACDQRMAFFRRVEIDSFDAAGQSVLPHLVIADYNNPGGLDMSNIQSDTKQLTWNQQSGWLRVFTPRFISATGQLRNAIQTFDNITVEKTDTAAYGTFTWISTDTNSISESSHSLITIAGRVANYGAMTDGDTTIWRGWGRGGVQADGLTMRFSMRSAFDSLFVRPLDSLGNPSSSLITASRSSSGRFTFELDQKSTGSQWFRVEQKRVINNVAHMDESSLLTIAPMPVREHAIVDMPVDVPLIRGRLTVRDVVGREVRSISTQQNRSVVLQTGDLQAGVYVVELWTSDTLVSRTMMVKD